MIYHHMRSVDGIFAKTALFNDGLVFVYNQSYWPQNGPFVAMHFLNYWASPKWQKLFFILVPIIEGLVHRIQSLIILVRECSILVHKYNLQHVVVLLEEFEGALRLKDISKLESDMNKRDYKTQTKLQNDIREFNFDSSAIHDRRLYW